MRLAKGVRIGRFEIVDLLGAGAMGEVYRARDPELAREVAIKVLPAELAADAQRVERMEREARAVGRLNHPNLLAIHDLGRHDGTPYLVCELLAGKTLRDHLARGRLEPRQVIVWAAQIAAGLAAAHDAGVVHRDLKPENLFVDRDGGIKILDFGLAKTSELAPPGDADPTLAALTEERSLLGTAGYMAPEQAAGRRVDFRADQFALGTVLYEMLSGRRPFTGETGAEILTAILRKEPEPLREIVPGLPAPLVWIVERCLAKEPAERYASTRDLARDLATLRNRAGELASDLAPAPGRRRPGAPAILAALALALVVAAAAFLAGRQSASPSLATYEQLTFRRGMVTAARFDPDGESVLYSAAWDGEPSRLYLLRPGTPEPIVVGPPGSVLSAVSSRHELLITTDHRSRGPFLRTGTLSRMPMAGTPRAFDEDVSEAIWGSDGELLALVRSVERQSVLEFPPGSRRYATRGTIWHLRASPDDRRVAFVEIGHLGANFGPIVVLDEEVGERRLGMSGNLQGLAWSPAGNEVWFVRQRSLVAARLDGRERVVVNLPQRAVLHDIAPDGRVLLAVEPPVWEMAGKPAGSHRVRDLTWLSWSLPFALSDDGETVVFNECTFDQGVCSIGLRGFGDQPPVVLGTGFAFALSTDGSQVMSIPPWQQNRLTLVPTGPGEGRTFDLSAVGIERATFGSWLPGSGEVLLAGARDEGQIHVYRYGLDSGELDQITRQPLDFGFFAISPDGARVAVQHESGELAVYGVASGEPEAVLGRGEHPIQWSADGRHLYIARLFAPPPIELRRIEIATGTTETVAVLRPADPAGVRYIGPIAVSRSGEAWAFGYPRHLSELFVVRGL